MIETIEIREKTSVTKQELLDWVNDSAAFFNLDIERLSFYLLAQIFSSEQNRVFSTYNITDTIKSLEKQENTTLTKVANKFRHYPLDKFYKKHFFDSRYLSTNLKLHLHDRKFNQIIDNFL